MKKQLFLLLGICVHVFGFSQTIDLSLSLNKKEVYNQKMTSKISVKQKVNNQNIVISTQTQTDIIFNIQKKDNHILDCKVTYSDISMDMNTSIDDKNLEFGKMKQYITNAIQNIEKQPFEVKIDKKGKFLKINKIDPIIQKSIQKLVKQNKKNPPTKVQQEQVFEQLQKVFKEETFSNLESVMAIFPRHRVKKGDSWEVSSFLSNGMNITIKTTYTLSEITHKNLIINGISSFHFDNHEVILKQGQQVFFSLQGEISTELKLNRQTKWIEYAQQTQTIKGTSHQKGRSEQKENIIPIETFSEIIIQNQTN